jgi:hypothetical protein
MEVRDGESVRPTTGHKCAKAEPAVKAQKALEPGSDAWRMGQK